MPVKIQAQNEKLETKIEYQTPIPETLYAPPRDVVEELFAAYLNTQSRLKRPSYGSNFCSCVTYLETRYGFSPGVIGWATNWPVNAKSGDIGEVIVFGGPRGHVAFITGFNAQGWIVDEANFVSCTHTTGRVVPFDSPNIKGFWIES